jgi:hypothetical protein
MNLSILDIQQLRLAREPELCEKKTNRQPVVWNFGATVEQAEYTILNLSDKKITNI